MKVQLRRFVTIGLMSGSLALSAIAGGAVVGAAAPNSTPDRATISTDAPAFRNDDRDSVISVIAPTEQNVTITPASAVTPATTPVHVQLLVDDRRN